MDMETDMDDVHLNSVSSPVQTDPHALKNSLRKSAATNLSLIAATTAITMVLSLGLRMAISRVLGPERVGGFYFAESMANMFFTFLPLGIGTFISRTVPPHPTSISRYFSSICTIQGITAIVIFFAFLGTLLWRQYTSGIVIACLVMGLYVALFRFQDAILKNIFYARGDTKLVSVVNIWVKVALVVLGLFVLCIHPSVILLAACFVLSEMVGFIWLFYKGFRLSFFSTNISFKQIWHIVKIGLPFYVASVLVGIYQNVGPSMLSTYGNNEETGYFGSAIRITGIWMLFIPILYNALMPLLSKALGESKEAFVSFAREIFELFAIALLPLAFALSVFGDYITVILYGDAFMPTQKILSHLTLYLILAYFNTISCILALLLWRGTYLIAISAAALAINVVLNYFAIPWGMALWGKGGGALGIALAITISEGFVCLSMLARLRGTIVTPRVIYVLLLTCVGPVLWSIFYDDLKPLGFGARVLLYLAGSIGVLLMTGSFTPRRLRKMVQLGLKFWRARRAR